MKLAALAIATITVAQTPSLATVLAKLDAYLAAYEPRLSELVADEVMQQEVRIPAPVQPSDFYRGRRETRLRRRLDSEVAFIALPNDSGWLGFRHVKAVNTKPVGLSDASLIDSLKKPGLDAARAMVNDSSAHNLGLPRTTNLPNLPLEFLHTRNRQRLIARHDGAETVRGVRTRRLVLLERMTPTLIRNPNTGGDMPSVIRAWVDPRDGRLLRAEVSTFNTPDAKSFEHFIRVEFTENKALSLLVPGEMREEFPVERPGHGTSVATYTNFRKFQTSARIVPQ